MREFLDQLVVLVFLFGGVLWTMFMGVFVTSCFVLFGEKTGHRAHRLWAKGVCWVIGIRVELLFEHQLPKTGGFLLASNHESLYDIPVLASCPIDFKWISKREVGQVPFIGWAMKTMGCYFLTRRKVGKDLNVLQNVEEGLRRGASILIFPEGTRTRTGKMLPLKKGAFKACQNSAAPLVPVAIWGTFAIAPADRLPKRRGHRVTVRIGPPMHVPPDTDVEPSMEQFRVSLTRLLDENVV